MKPVIPKTACTAKTTRNESSRLEVVAVKPRAPARIRNAPSEATMLIAWSAKKDLQEKTRRGGRWLSGMGATVTDSCGGANDGITGTGSTSAWLRTGGANGSCTTGTGETAGAAARSCCKVYRRHRQ